MDEAELLCTRIGILVKGKMKCLGNQQHLKNNYGKGYRLIVNFQEKNRDSVLSFLQIIDNLTIDYDFKGTLECHIGTENTSISNIFSLLERKSKEVGIVDWGFSQMGLGDVFQKVVKENHEKEEKKNMVNLED